MDYPWSETVEAFALSQLKQTVNFWKLGQSASYCLETSSEGRANLVTRFQLPKPSEHLPPLRPHCNFPSKTHAQHKPGNQVLIPSKTPEIPPLFPFGPPQPSRQVTRRHTQSPKSPSQLRRDYVRAARHRARISAQVKPVDPGTLTVSPPPVQQPTLPLLPPSAPLQSTPSHPQKRKRTNSSPPTFREKLLTEFSITEPELEPSLPPSPEHLRSNTKDVSLELTHTSDQAPISPLTPTSIPYPEFPPSDRAASHFPGSSRTDNNKKRECDFDCNEKKVMFEDFTDEDNNEVSKYNTDNESFEESPRYKIYSLRTYSLMDILFEDEVGSINEAGWLLLQKKEEDMRRAAAALETTVLKN